MIRIFRDKQPITDCNDTRLQELREVLKWFKAWKKELRENNEANNASDKPQTKYIPALPSDQCLMDVESMLYTFEDVCQAHLKDFPDGEIVPSRFNSDPVENHFCQTRGLHNNNNNNNNNRSLLSVSHLIQYTYSCKAQYTYHGGNLTNPTYYEYCTTVNAIILGQSMRSRGRKSNAGMAAAKPYNVYTNKPISHSGKVKTLRM